MATPKSVLDSKVVSVGSVSSTSSPSSPGSGSEPLLLSSSTGSPNGSSAVPVAVFAIATGIAHAHASTVRRIAPLSPHNNVSSPTSRLLLPLPSNIGSTVKSSLVNSKIEKSHALNPAAARSSSNCKLNKLVFPKFSILNS